MGALVSDFQHLYQLDFMGVFRGDLSPRRALYLIEGLANYPESIYRAEVSGMEGVVGYDRNSVILADLVDTVNNLTYATMKAANGKPRKPKPYPRPVANKDKIMSGTYAPATIDEFDAKSLLSTLQMK